MNKKENDLMLNLVANPSFSIGDFTSVGLNASNTSLQSAEYYKNNPFILLKFTKEDGRFDDKAFNQAYQSAQVGYVMMALGKAQEDLKNQFKYAATNMTVSADKRQNIRDQYLQIVVANPTRQSRNLIGWGEESRKKFSDDELALLSKVLLNPLTAGDNFENAKWGDTPHEGFFDYWNKTLVMATWDSDGEHIDPVTGITTKHLKGEYKIGPNGSYYYETLDGRDIYGKKVLNKMNTLTEEGSFANKYLDFLDSDDIHKSAGGTIMKNLALIGSMFIPYVGPVVTGLSLVPLLAGLMGTLGKMATGSENGFLSELEGFKKSWELQGNVSEESQQSTWNLENFINLIGDTVAQLKQLRFIFEKIPVLFKGKYAGSAKAQEAIRQNYENEAKTLYNTKLTNLQEAINDPKSLLTAVEYLKSVNDMAALKALAETDSYIKGYNKIGEILSKGYMTGITVADTYGEAKEAGASDLEATLLTLGYGAAEAWLLNTEIGEWILPELHNHRLQNKLAVRKLMDHVKGTKNAGSSAERVAENIVNGDKTNKKAWAQKVINSARDFFKGEYFAAGTKSAKTIVGASIAGGLGEAVEETSEELLADVSKGIFNTLQWLKGDDVRLDSFGYSWKSGEREWNGLDLVDRYGMSFFGGLIGGGITNVGTAYNISKDSSKKDAKWAYQHVVYSARNGELDSIRKELDKYDTGASDTIAANPTEDTNGNLELVGTGSKSLNYQAKKMVNQVFDFVEDTLNESKVNLTDHQFLDKLILGEWRYQSLYNSQTALDFLQDYNNLCTLLVALRLDILNIEKELRDLNGDGTVTDTEERHAQIDKANTKLENAKELFNITQKKLLDYVEGKYSTQFMAQAFFEMSSFLNKEFGIVSLPIYVEQKYGKKLSEFDDDRKQAIILEYEEYKKNPTLRDYIKSSAEFLLLLDLQLSPALQTVISEVNSPEYEKAREIFSLRVKPENVRIEDDDDFAQALGLGLESGLIFAKILNQINPTLYALIYDEGQRELEAIQLPFKDQILLVTDTYLLEVLLLVDDNKTANELLQLLHDLEVLLLTDDNTKVNDDLQKAYDDKLQELLDKLAKAEEDYNNATTPGQKGSATRRKNLAQRQITALEATLPSIQLQIVDNNTRVADEVARKLEAFTNAVNTNNTALDSTITTKKSEAETTINGLNNTLEEESENYKKGAFLDKLVDLLMSDLNTYLPALIDKGYIDSGLKSEILSTLANVSASLMTLQQEADANYDYDLADSLQLKATEIANYSDAIKNLPATKLEAVLNTFSINTTGLPLNYSELIERIYDTLSAAKDPSDIKETDRVSEAIGNALIHILMLKAVLKCATTDTISIVLGSPFGYNAMLNAISEKRGTPLNLALISSDETLPIIAELNRMLNLLLYMQRVFEINRGNKFALQERAGTALTKARFDALLRFIDRGDSNPLKDWNEYNELEVSLRNALSVNMDNAEEVNSAKVLAEDAIYDFAQKNLDKLKDKEAMKKFIASLDFIRNSESNVANENTNFVNDTLLAHYLISCMAMKTSSFYHALSQLDFGGVAPIPLQIEAARMAMARIVNKDLFKTYFQAISLSVLDKLNGLSTTEFSLLYSINKKTSVPLEILDNPDVWLDSLDIPIYSAITLVEGIAGSGKTKGVFTIVNKIIDTIPQLNKGKYFVHGAKPENAATLELANELFGVGNAKAFTRKEFMEHFVLNFLDLIYDERNNTYNAPNNAIKLSNGRVVTTLTINSTAEVPSVIFIDEITLFSATDLLLINKWARDNNIDVIAAGDFHLNIISAKTPITLTSGATVNYTMDPTNNGFYGPPKLGLTMRTGNSVKTSNLLKFESFLQNTTNYSENIILEYTKLGKLLYGDFKSDNVDTVLLEIRDIITTLDSVNNEQITCIYDSEQSELYLALQDPEFAGKIAFKKGNQALGDETRYSIVDLSLNYAADDKKKAATYMYTGMTRASQGSIIYIKSPLNISMQTYKIDSMYSETGYLLHLELYSLTLLQKLQNTYRDSDDIVYVEPSNVPAQQNTPLRLSQLNTPQGQQSLNNLQNTPLFRVSDLVIFDGTLVASIRNVNPDGTYDIIDENGNDHINISERRLLPYVAPAVKNHFDDYLALVGLSVDEANNIKELALLNNYNAIHTLLALESLQDSVFNSYPYIGLDSLDLLFKLLSGDTSLLNNETDITRPHQFYIFGNFNNPVSNISDIKYIFVDNEYQNLFDYILLEFGLNLTIGNLSDMVNYINMYELAKYESNVDYGDFLDEEVNRELEAQRDEYEEWLRGLGTPSLVNPLDPFNQMSFDIQFYNFNSLELGAVLTGTNSYDWDLQGIYNAPGLLSRPRIDSANGLRLLSQLSLTSNDFSGVPQFIKRAVNERKLKETLLILGALLNMCLTETSKASLILRLSNYLGIDDLYIDFAIKRIPPRSQVERTGLDITANTLLHKDVNEQVYGLDKTANNADRVSSLLLVAIIGLLNYGDVLELPLFSLTNPITLIHSMDLNGLFRFPQAYNTFLRYRNTGDGWEVRALQDIVQNQVGNPDLQRYCKLYLSGKYFLFRYGARLYNPTTGRYEAYPNADTWLPATHLQNKGIVFTLSRGLFQADPTQLVYSVLNTTPENWTDLSDYYMRNPNSSWDPRMYYSEVLQVPNSGILMLSDGRSVLMQPGHNFILVALDKTIRNTEEILQRFIEERLPGYTGNQTVKEIYVYAPEAKVTLYVNYLRKSLDGLTLSYKIGYRNTIHKLTSLILQDSELRLLFYDKNSSLSVGWITTEELNQLIQGLDSRYNAYLQDPYNEDLRKEYFNFFKSPFKNGTVENYLTNFFVKLTTEIEENEFTSNPDAEVINKIQTLLDNYNALQRANNGRQFLLTYTPRLMPNTSIFGASRLLDVLDGTMLIDGRKVSFKVRGKLNSLTFEGKIPFFDWLINHCYSNLELLDKKSARYLYKPYDITVSPNVNPTEEALNKISRALLGTGITYQVPEGITSERVALETFVLLINNKTDFDFIAYLIGNNLFISNRNTMLKNKVIKFSKNGTTLTTLQNGDEFTMSLIDGTSTENLKAKMINNVIYYELATETQGITLQEVEDTYNSINNDNILNLLNSLRNDTGALGLYASLDSWTSVLELIDNSFESEDRQRLIEQLPDSELKRQMLNLENLILSMEDENTCRIEYSFTPL